ncbi:MAG: hypothetical protein AB1468_03015 [Candidatus Micrarchaeota archaeon]
MKRLVGIFALFLAMMLLGCTGGGGVGPGGTVDDLSLVPEGVDTVVLIKVADVVNDAAVKSKVNDLISDMSEYSRKIYIDGKSRTYDDLDELCSIYESEYGLNPKSITRLIIFGDVMQYFGGAYTGGSTPYMGFIVRGTFDKKKILDQFAGKYELDESKYKDITLYTQDMESESKPYLAFPDDSTLILATEEAVKDVIDARAGGKSVRDVAKMMKVLGEINTDAWLVFGARVPSQVKEGFRNAGEGSAIGDIDVSVFAKVDYFGLSITKNGENIDMRSALLATSSSAAGDISDEMKSAKEAAVEEIQNVIDSGSVPSEYEDIMNALKTTISGMTIDTKDDVVVVGASMPLDDLIQFFTFFYGFATPSPVPAGNYGGYE